MLEPIKFSDVLFSDYQYFSSYLMNIYFVKKDYEIISETINKAYFEDIISEKERRIEDFLLQSIVQNSLSEQNKKQLENISKIKSTENKEIYKEIDRVNFLNKNILYNTVNRIKEVLRKTLGLTLF